MSVYFITGKLGTGKTLAAVGKLFEYLAVGRIVATNLDLFFEHAAKKKSKDVMCYRLPDKPTTADMEAIGIGNESYDESKNGLIVLDECGTWFNSRTWNDPDRRSLMDWFLHARKKGWDILFIVQDMSIIDKQARETLCEYSVYCKRLDALPIPLITSISKLLGWRITWPKIHAAIVKYGDSPQYMTVDRWIYRGHDLYKKYDTKQIFADRGNGVSCYLTPWHLVGRYMPVITWQTHLINFGNTFIMPPLRIIFFIAWLLGRIFMPPLAVARKSARVVVIMCLALLAGASSGDPIISHDVIIGEPYRSWSDCQMIYAGRWCLDSIRNEPDFYLGAGNLQKQGVGNTRDRDDVQGRTDNREGNPFD